MKTSPIVGIIGFVLSLSILLIMAQETHTRPELLTLVALSIAAWLTDVFSVQRAPSDFSGSFVFVSLLGLSGDAVGALLLLLSCAFLRQARPGLSCPWDLAWATPGFLVLLAGQLSTSSPDPFVGAGSLVVTTLCFYFGSRFMRKRLVAQGDGWERAAIEKEQAKLRLLLIPFCLLGLFLNLEQLKFAVFAFPVFLAVQQGTRNAGFRVRAQMAEFAEAEARESQRELAKTQDRLASTSRKQKMTERLAEVFEQSLTPERAFRELCRSTSQVVDYRSIVLFRLNDSSELVPVWSDTPESDLLYKATMLLKREPLVEKAWLQDRSLRGTATKLRTERLLSHESQLVVIPLKPFGVLYFGRASEAEFTKTEASKLVFVAKRAESALVRAEETAQSKAKLREETERSQSLQKQVSLTSQLLEVSQKFILATTSRQVFQTLNDALRDSLPGVSGVIKSQSEPVLFGRIPLPVEALSGLEESALSQSESIYLPSLSQSGLKVEGTTLESVLVVPLPLEDRQPILLFLGSPRVDAFARERQDFISTLAHLAARALDSLRLHGQLEEAHQKVVQASKLNAIGRLAAGVAHELNSPLAAVRLAIDSAMIRPQSAADTLAQAELALDRADEVIAELLDHYRQKDVDRDLIKVRELFEGSAKAVKSRLEFKDQKLTLSCQDPDLQVFATRSELVRILVNLLSNASDASSNSSEIVLRAKEIDKRIVMEVVDQGTGIPEKIRDRVLEPFFTTKGAGDGAGLGLSVCTELAERHQGRLSFKSTEGEGSIFRVDFPARRHSGHSILS